MGLGQVIVRNGIIFAVAQDNSTINRNEILSVRGQAVLASYLSNSIDRLYYVIVPFNNIITIRTLSLGICITILQVLYMIVTYYNGRFIHRGLLCFQHL